MGSKYFKTITSHLTKRVCIRYKVATVLDKQYQVKYVSVGYFRHHPRVSDIKGAENLGQGLLHSVISEAGQYKY